MAIIAQLSDIHLAVGRDGEVDDGSGPVRSLRAAVSSLLALPARPDAVVLTGDLADGGRPIEYARLHALLSPLPMAVYPLPGNHDDRDALRHAFRDHPAVAGSGGPGEPVQYAVDVAGTRLVCLDTTIPGSTSGELDLERLAWLDATLAEHPDVPTVIAMHHPPYPIGIRFIDDTGLAGTEGLAEIFKRHRQVVRVMSGHVHRSSAGSLAGTPCTTTSSTYRQLFLDLTRPGRAALTGEPAGFSIHLIEGESAVTHFVPTGNYRPLMEVD